MPSQLATIIDELVHAQARLDRPVIAIPKDRCHDGGDPSVWSLAECQTVLVLPQRREE